MIRPYPRRAELARILTMVHDSVGANTSKGIYVEQMGYYLAQPQEHVESLIHYLETMGLARVQPLLNGWRLITLTMQGLAEVERLWTPWYVRLFSNPVVTGLLGSIVGGVVIFVANNLIRGWLGWPR